MIIYLIQYFLFLLFGAMIINGFFNVTRGNYVTCPDGMEKKEGQLLKGWYFFWFAKKEDDTLVQYKGAELSKILGMWQGNAGKFGIAGYFSDHVLISTMPDQSTITMISSGMGLHVRLEKGPDGIEARFYKAYPTYVHPVWVRKMMAGCVTCHSSWLGSIIYWLGFHFIFDANNSISLVVATWFAYCISLCFLSPYLWKKIS